MTKATPKKAATSKAKADDVPDTAVPDKDHLDDEHGQPVEQKKVDQGPDVEHPTVAPGNEEAAKPLHNPELVEEHANEVSHVVSTEQTKDHSDPSEVAQAALADPNVPLGQDADPNGPDDLR